ncbi:MAG: chromosomal replication initiator protein DnaA [Candidatus Colwellbacteria bacterium]|nr:chromosomal replication initiator protein DnaA [Candidatus Colwellbacteria bacterium]
MTPQQIWETALGELELELSRANFNTWLRNTKVLEKRNEVMIVGVPDSFTKEWLENKYYDRIMSVLRGVARDIKKIHYEIKTDLFKPAPLAPERRRVDFSREPSPLPIEFSKLNKGGLNPRYLFSNFVVGSFNELAHAATLAICSHPGKKFNPVFIYGGIGLGKTHLIQAAGNYFLESKPDLKVKYIAADRFSSEYIQAVKNSSLEEFKDAYAKYDILLVDDIQFLAGKEKSQEIFFHTFNHLYQKNRQIILSSDRPARAIPMLQTRLRSRFEGGMIADIVEPDGESRAAILYKKLEEKECSLPSEIVEIIAGQVQTNIRELEGVLNTVITYVELNGAMSKDTLQGIITKLNILSKRSTSFDRIIEVVTQFYSIAKEELMRDSRRQETAFPRQVIMYLLRRELDYSFPQIGRKLGDLR